MIGRVEVLEQVGGLLLLSNTEYAATEMVVKNNGQWRTGVCKVCTSSSSL